MAKDERWEEIHKQGQKAIEQDRRKQAERKKQQIEKQKREAKDRGEMCIVCEGPCDIYIEDKKIRHQHYGPYGGGSHVSSTQTWHYKISKCRKCGHDRVMAKWKEPSTWDKIVEWFKSLFD